jgi:ribonuclease-3
MPELEGLEAALGHRFRRRDLIEEALTHASAVRRHGPRHSYERLEFLGDRVLGLVLAEMLLKAFPREVEGALARRLAQLARAETLAAVAAELGLGRHVRMAALEDPAVRETTSVQADLCEAVIAALYLDGGLAVARRFIETRWTAFMTSAATPPKDPKTALQEWAQARGLDLPAYRVVEAEGPAHRPRFTVAVAVAGRGEASASGTSKRLAETAAARALMDRLTGEER